MFPVIKEFASFWERLLLTVGKPSVQVVGTKMGTVLRGGHEGGTSRPLLYSFFTIVLLLGG
jgi:hypothetical protein